MKDYFMIKGYEGFYSISTDGEIINCNNMRVVKQHISTKGYPQVRLNRYGITKQVRVHRLLAETFIPNPNNYPVVNHIDGNKENNNIHNLEWTTISGNVGHAWGAGLNECRGSHNGRALLNDEKVIEILKLKKQGKMNKEIAVEFGVSPNAISSIVNGKTWTHITR